MQLFVLLVKSLGNHFYFRKKDVTVLVTLLKLIDSFRKWQPPCFVFERAKTLYSTVVLNFFISVSNEHNVYVVIKTVKLRQGSG